MLDYGKTEIRVGCYAEYLHINKYTFGARENIYYLLSIIYYLKTSSTLLRQQCFALKISPFGVPPKTRNYP